MNRTESNAPYRIDKDTNVPQWISTVFYYCRHARNRANHILVVSAMSGTVFQDNSFSAADHRHQQKRPYIHTVYTHTYYSDLPLRPYGRTGTSPVTLSIIL